MPSIRRAFVVMPFGKKPGPGGIEIDCDAIFKDLLAPALSAAGLAPHRADADRRGGSIHEDMFQDLLLAEFVVADLTLDNPNVWYEIGVRHALRSGGTVMTYALRDRLPFDIAGQRMQRYTLVDGKLDPNRLEDERTRLKDAIVATMDAWRGRRASPVYQQLPNLQEPDWKTLRVGSVNQFWEALDAWQGRIKIAVGNQRPGDILVLADDTPNSILEVEALNVAAEALLQLKRPRYALSVSEQALKLNPDNLRARQLQGMALGRMDKHAEARQNLQSLAEKSKDGETQGIFARTWKDEWLLLWKKHPARKSDPLAAARDTAETLQAAAAAYIEAFRSAPTDYYPGINALTLGRLWEHITGEKSELPLDTVAAGISWCIDIAIGRKKDYWNLASRAELALVENRAKNAIDDYAAAVMLAVRGRERFALDSSKQQLDFLGTLNFRNDIVGKAIEKIRLGERQLDDLIDVKADAQPEPRPEPKNAVVFTGHMIDNPAKRGPGTNKPARFPAAKIDAALAAIRAALEKIGAGPGDLGVCGGASGGDLLFAEACLERRMRLDVRLARSEPEFLAESVTFADPEHRWESSFLKVRDHPATTLFIMPDELGPTPEGTSVHDRCNRWILYSALSQGLSKVSFVALWNGAPGDGPGGTQHMVELVGKLTGRQPEIINPTTL